MLDSAIGELNHIYKEGKLARVDVAFDYEGFRIFDKPENTQDSIVERMRSLREQYDILIYCPLIDGEFGSGMKLEYNAILRINNTLPPENKIYIECFIRIKEGVSDHSYPELLDKNNTGLQVCNWYRDDHDFKSVVKDTINGIILSYPKKNIEPSDEASSEEPENIKEPSAENSIDKKSEEGATNCGRGRVCFFKIIILSLIVALPVLYWKQCSASNPEDPLAPHITQIDSTRTIINERVSVAEAMVKQGMFDAAKDTLEAIKKDCHPEWVDLLLKINTLESLIPAQPIPYGTPGAIGGQHETESKPVYLHDGFVLTGLSGDFENYVLTQIETTSELRRAPGKKVQWGISITERKNQRGLDDGDYFVDLSVSVSIINNKTGKSLPQLPLYKNECIGSPISYEDAFNAAASEEFAKLIAIGIVNAIKNEN